MRPSPVMTVPVADLIELACRAPSVHNSQPWLWLIDGYTVTLFADYRRHLEHTDPDGRDLLLSCGAALHHLKVAAAAAGWDAKIRRLPNPSNDAQLASVTFTPHDVDESAAHALEVLRRRRTDRRRTASSPVAREQLDTLLDEARQFGIVAFAVVSAQAKAMLFALLAEADAAQRRNPNYLQEITEWIDRGQSEGVPATNLLQHPPAAGDHGSSTRFPPGLLPDALMRDADRQADALLALCTSGDDVASKLRTGEALSAVLLLAESKGLSALPLSQATEVDRIRRTLQDELLQDAAYPQILIRVGWPAHGAVPVPLTPRRPIHEVMCDTAHLPAHLGPYRA
jgi:nitroreductase